MNNSKCICIINDCPLLCNENYWSCKNNICIHDDFELNFNNFILIFFVFIISYLSSIVGIGGGGLLLPLYYLVGNFKTYYTIPLCVITIAGNSLCRMLFLFNKKHYLNSYRFLINYLLLILVLPFDSAFSIFGFILNFFTPIYVTKIILVTLLYLISFKTLMKAYKYFKINGNKVLEGISFNFNKKTNIEIDGIILDIKSDDYLKIINEKKGESWYICYLYQLFFIFLCNLSYLFVNSKKNLAIYSKEYLLFSVFQIVTFLVISFFTILYVKKEQIKRNINFFYLENEIIWNNKKIIIFTIVSSIISILSTFLGIGGGMLFVPFLILNNIPPEIASSTNSVSTFYSSITSTIQYIGSDRILPYYSIAFFLTSFISSYFGLKTFKLISKYNKKSILIIILGLLILTSAIIMTSIIINENL